tara:strand:+ start:1200 stop:1307 length:108 start_codon:yes stop_codon:yes gene_type:complete
MSKRFAYWFDPVKDKAKDEEKKKKRRKGQPRTGKI